MKLTELTGKVALQEIERQLDELRLRIHALEQKKIKATEAKPYITGFEEFWKSYPKKVGKGYAEKAWAKIRPDRELLDKMLSSLKAARRCEDWVKENGQFIPHPSSWLNAKGWESEYKPMQAVHPSQVVKTRPVEKEVDLEWDKKVALWEMLPVSEKEKRLEASRDSFSNQAFATPLTIKTRAISSL